MYVPEGAILFLTGNTAILKLGICGTDFIKYLSISGPVLMPGLCVANNLRLASAPATLAVGHAMEFYYIASQEQNVTPRYMYAQNSAHVCFRHARNPRMSELRPYYVILFFKNETAVFKNK